MGTALVPVTRTVVGEPQELQNLVDGHRERGTLISFTPPVVSRTRRGEYALVLTYQQKVRRITWLTRLRDLCWPAGRRWYVYAGRVMVMSAAAAAATLVGYVAYVVIRFIVGVVEWLIAHAVLIAEMLGASVAIAVVACVYAAFRRVCDKCGGTGHL